ncbi:AraC family transcriptional regulator [Martelella endophytica]|uniref:AraC family transcriptional regulator n=1 Tax=Martelella endophytica TaxID=1486262 RepID=A0A0D5LUD5_MAREN|nr:AraC family transcriptional regulator [Martelella endophytica]AJY47681.1 AraC family transcriptional regulator [Martelella endophytica]
MDPLSDLLSLLRPSATVSSGFEAGGAWCVDFGDQTGKLKCYAILSGTCLLQIEGVAEPIRLQAGEAFVLPRGCAFKMAGHLAAEPVSASVIFPPARAGGQVVVGTGGEFTLAGARFAVSGGAARLLLDLLPPIVHLRGSTERAAMRWSLERMIEEMREARPGSELMAQDLAHMMLLQTLRAHLERSSPGEQGWLAALSDKNLRLAVAAIHADPARRWTLQALAAEAGMSRTVFAERFRTVMGETPMQYLARWRMALACDRLEHAGSPLAEIASDLGYASLSAFVTAFRRLVGVTPQQFRRARQSLPETPALAAE